METFRAWLRNISGIMSGLNRRERIFVNSAAVFVVLFLLIRFAVAPLWGQQSRLEMALDKKEKTLREILSVQKEVAAINQTIQDAGVGPGKRDKDFTLFSFLDGLAGESGVKNSITYMKPSTEESETENYRLSLVEMKLEAVNLENLVSYLYKIETSRRMVFVKRLSISRHEKEVGGVDAVIQVVTVTG